MIPLLLGSAAVAGLVTLAAVGLIHFHNWAYKAGVESGFRKGCEEGRKLADNWWYRAESDVDQARVKIWREEAQL